MEAREYWDEVARLGKYFSDNNPNGEGWAADYDNQQTDMRQALHETIDGHRFIIYYSKAQDVMRYTDNTDAYQDVTGDDMPANTGFLDLCCKLACWAMTQDVTDRITGEE